MKKLGLLTVVIIIVGIGYLIFGSRGKSESLEFRQRGDNPIQREESGKEKDMEIKSAAFEDGDVIPVNYTCDGENISPPLSISGVPEVVKSLVLIIDDPDAPAGTWNHFLAWNIDPKTTEIKEGQVPQGAVLGKNDFGKLEYGGPCPPSGTHRYLFRLLGLDILLDLQEGAVRSELDKAIQNHVIETALLMGKYSR